MGLEFDRVVRGRDRGVTRRYARVALADERDRDRDRLERVDGVGGCFFLDGLPLLGFLHGLPTGRGWDGTTTAVLLDGRLRVLGGEASEGDTAVAAGDGVDVTALIVLFLME